MFGQVAKPQPRGKGTRRRVFTQHTHRRLWWADQAKHELDHRGLARAIMADKCNIFPRHKPETCIAYGVKAAIGLGNLIKNNSLGACSKSRHAGLQMALFCVPMLSHCACFL
ncbi:Uncharacterised protein [Brucella melitensis]|nr:Uncharacterised protein [Brucella melitensis]